ncbi:MAG: efflux RND transporter periplasmic adaptor subunit [Methylococcales bacterium]|nr:efflux RND transporter periplasmic adaptor subunit [Methylococcales bacterium]MDD5632526.1 efflux RND transporter periplasmic adaptor subunit [Methylococcales bacterium]
MKNSQNPIKSNSCRIGSSPNSIFFLAVICALFISGCEKPKEQALASPPLVKVTPVMQQDVPIQQEWVGTLDGMVNAQINAQVVGYLIKQNYKEGDLVKKNQLLYEIDPRTYEATLAQAKANLAQQQAVLITNQLAMNRIKRLLPEKAVSVLDRDNAVGAVASSEAQVLAAQAAVQTAQLNLSFTKITSPINGIAGISHAQLGDLVGPGTATNELTQVSQVEPIRAYIGLNEKQYFRLAKRQEENGGQPKPIPLQLTLADNSIYPHNGRFYFADRQVNVNTGTIKVAVLYSNPDNILRPGMFVRIRATTDIMKDALVVPQQAVIRLQTAIQVAVVNADKTISIRPVQLGETSGSMIIIENGLKPGEQVVVEGLQKIREGMKVTPEPYKEPETDTKAAG